jgi:hypothetical protein
LLPSGDAHHASSAASPWQMTAGAAHADPGLGMSAAHVIRCFMLEIVVSTMFAPSHFVTLITNCLLVGEGAFEINGVE